MCLLVSDARCYIGPAPWLYGLTTPSANWRHNFYATNPHWEQWKANRVRLDVGEIRCSCAPAVRNHRTIPPFRSPQGWTINPHPLAVPWEAFFWHDPDA